VSHPPDFITRTLGALNKIVEEDWRREMQREREEELKVSELPLIIIQVYLYSIIDQIVLYIGEAGGR